MASGISSECSPPIRRSVWPIFNLQWAELPLVATDMKPLEAFHMKCQRQILGIHCLTLSVMSTCRRNPDGPSHLSFWTHCPDWVMFLHIWRSAGTSICHPSDWKRRPGSTPHSMDRLDSMGLDQFTSGTLKACQPPWPCYWSDATAPVGYATLMMMMMTELSSQAQGMPPACAGCTATHCLDGQNFEWHIVNSCYSSIVYSHCYSSVVLYIDTLWLDLGCFF